MTKKVFIFLVLVTMMALSACAPKLLTREQLNQYPNLVELEKKLDSAKEKDVHLLAPVHYQQALDKYLEAYAAVQSGYKEDVTQNVSSGMRSLNQALWKFRNKKQDSEIRRFTSVRKARRKSHGNDHHAVPTHVWM